MRNKLSDEAERLLKCDTAHHVDNMRVVSLCYLLHHLNLTQEISLLLPRCRRYGNNHVTVVSHVVLLSTFPRPILPSALLLAV